MRQSGRVPAPAKALVAVLVVAAVGGGGYLAVHHFGWERAARFVGIDVTHTRTAAASQCNRAHEQDSQDVITLCVPDTEWLRRYINACLKNQSPDLVYVDAAGDVSKIARCTPQIRAEARRYAGRRIPADYRVADVVQGSGQ